MQPETVSVPVKVGGDGSTELFSVSQSSGNSFFLWTPDYKCNLIISKVNYEMSAAEEMKDDSKTLSPSLGNSPKLHVTIKALSTPQGETMMSSVSVAMEASDAGSLEMIHGSNTLNGFLGKCQKHFELQ